MASKVVPTPQVFSKSAILSTYRQLLRATYIAFQGTSNPTAVNSSHIFLNNKRHSPHAGSRNTSSFSASL